MSGQRRRDVLRHRAVSLFGCLVLTALLARHDSWLWHAFDAVMLLITAHVAAYWWSDERLHDKPDTPTHTEGRT